MRCRRTYVLNNRVTSTKVYNKLARLLNSRLEFWNLKPQDSSNALSKDEEDKIWLPTLVFSNTEQNDITEGDVKSELIVARQTQAR